MRRSHGIVLAMLSALLVAASAGAGDERGADVAAFRSPTLAPLSRIALAVGGIGATGGAVALWARRRRRAAGIQSARIEVLASRSLSPRHRIALIEVADRRLLVGMGTDAIATLADLSDAPGFAAELEKRLPSEERQDGEKLLDVIGRFEGLDA